MKATFFIIVISILLSINCYVVVSGWQSLPPSSIFRPIYLISLIVLFLALMVSMIFGRQMPFEFTKMLSFIGFTYLIIFLYLFLAFLFVDLLRIVNHFTHFIPFSISIFRLWVLCGTLVLTGIALIIGNYQFNHPKIVTLNLIANKPSQQKELKIVAVSDLHLGISIDKQRLKSYVKLINDQHPDIVLLVGDLTDRWIEPLIHQNMAEELRSIQARMGVYAINGNHEMYAENPSLIADYLKSAGIKVLRDEVCLVENGFYIVGREDRSKPRRKILSELVKGLDSTKPIILMDHQPFHLEDAEQNNIDFQISGHTHNGQIFPGNLMVNLMYEQGYGYLKKGATHYYISSGLGIWGPHYRIGSQSEVVVIKLKY